MLASLATGCCGFVGSTFSIMGKVFDRLLNAYAAGDMKTARLEMERARNYSKIMYQSGNRYGEGIDKITDLARASVQLGSVSKSGAWFYYPNKESCTEDHKWQGEEAFCKYLKSHEDFKDKL